MRPYLEGYQFTVLTDHLSFKWLNSIENPSGRLARWALEQHQFNFTVQYRKGKHNIVADVLSRQTVEVLNLVSVQPQNIANCPWWKKLMEEVQTTPQKYAAYTIIEGQLRQINDEDCTPWKLRSHTVVRASASRKPR